MRPSAKDTARNAGFFRIVRTSPARLRPDGRAAVWVNCLARPSQTSRAAAIPARSCAWRKSRQNTTTSSAPTASGVSVSETVAPIPWIERAVARRSGNRVERAPMAGGCHAAVPSPINAAPTMAPPRPDATPKQKYPTPMKRRADARMTARNRAKESARMPAGRFMVPAVSWRADWR